MSSNDVAGGVSDTRSQMEVPITAVEHGESHNSSKLQSSLSYDQRPSSNRGVSSSLNKDENAQSRSEYYRLMYICLQEKFDYVQASTDRLRDRLYHVKKEVTYLKRMKRVLIRRLARYGEGYSYAPLEIPDNVDVEDPAMKRRKERRERERERKEAIRAAKRAQLSTAKVSTDIPSTEIASIPPEQADQPTTHCFDGAGDVFLGRCNDSSRVAIKRIPVDALDVTYDPSRAENADENTRTLVHAKSPDRGKLLREDVRLMRLLRHPHIIDFHACFVDGPFIYLMLGACSYGSATDVMLTSYPCGIPEKAIALILRQLLSALAYLHAQQIIHRSIRASHLLLDSSGGVRLTGFRLACKLPPDETSITDFDNHLEGSLLWSAPEVLGQDLSGYTTKADIYSVGASLCEMANGFPPFGDMNRLEMLYEKSRGTTPRLLDSTTLPAYEEPSEHSTRTFSEPFHSITGLCLKANPTNRPDAATLLAHPFLKKTKKSLQDLMPLAQSLELVQRVSGKSDVEPDENHDTFEWIF